MVAYATVVSWLVLAVCSLHGAIESLQCAEHIAFVHLTDGFRPHCRPLVPMWIGHLAGTRLVRTVLGPAALGGGEDMSGEVGGVEIGREDGGERS